MTWTRLDGAGGADTPLSMADALAQAADVNYVVTGAGFEALLACAEAGNSQPLGEKPYIAPCQNGWAARSLALHCVQALYWHESQWQRAISHCRSSAS